MDADGLLTELKEAPRFRTEVVLLLDAEAFAEARRLNERLERLMLDPDDGDVTEGGAVEVAERLVALHRDTPEVRFHLEARNAVEWDRLVADHPTEEEFAVALFAQSCVEPDGWTVDKAKALRDRLTVGQWRVVVTALQRLNEGLFDLRPTKAATVLTRGTRPKSTTAPPED